MVDQKTAWAKVLTKEKYLIKQFAINIASTDYFKDII